MTSLLFFIRHGLWPNNYLTGVTLSRFSEVPASLSARRLFYRYEVGLLLRCLLSLVVVVPR